MALSPTEESLVRQLIAQNPALLNLASSESTIISKLGATKVSLSDLSAATSLSDADLALVRQGLNDKSFAMSVLRDYVSANLPTASTTTKGIVELATNTETQTGADAVRAVTPAGLASVTATETRAGLVEKATAAEAQAFTADKFLDAAGLASAFLGSNVTKAPTGKLRLPGGLMLQWVSNSLLTIGSSTVNVTVNWNEPFSEAPYVAFSQAITNSPNNFKVSNGTPTTTGVTVFSYATSSTTLPFCVFAIGPWA